MVNRFLHDQQPPNPADALTAAQFVARMREFRSWSGLPYRQIQQRAAAAGFHLPHSTVAGALSRDTLPREDLLAAFITACGGDEPTVEQWLRMRRRLAVAAGRAGQERAQSAATILPATGLQPDLAAWRQLQRGAITALSVAFTMGWLWWYVSRQNQARFQSSGA